MPFKHLQRALGNKGETIGYEIGEIIGIWYWNQVPKQTYFFTSKIGSKNDLFLDLFLTLQKGV